jgi:hypothetical protein
MVEGIARWGMDMNASRFAEEQIIRVFAGASGPGEDGRHMPQAWDQQRDILTNGMPVWRSRSLGAKRLKALEDKNAKLLAETTLDKTMLKDFASKCAMKAPERKSGPTPAFSSR